VACKPLALAWGLVGSANPKFVARRPLQGAIDGGAFRVTGSVYDGLPDLPTILLTALEVARALEYLHSKNVLHGACLAGRQHRHAVLCRWASGQWSFRIQEPGKHSRHTGHGHIVVCADDIIVW